MGVSSGAGEAQPRVWQPEVRAAIGAAVLERLRTMTGGTVARCARLL